MFVPSMADSMRRTSMKSRTNHFVPPYTAPPGYAFSPATDDVATTCPDFCSMNVGSTAATPFRTPVTFTSTVWCQSSVFSADSGELGMRPAFRNMTSTPPNVSFASFTMASFSDGSVTSNLLVDGLAAVLLDLLDDLLQLVFAPRPEDELGALAREQLRGRFADPRRRAGDDHHFVADHVGPPLELAFR